MTWPNILFFSLFPSSLIFSCPSPSLSCPSPSHFPFSIYLIPLSFFLISLHQYPSSLLNKVPFLPSPYATSPSIPRRFGDYHYFTAPARPTRVSLFYRDFNEFVTSDITGRERRRGAEGEREERITSSGSGRRTARSYSPLRVSAYPWEEDDCRQLVTSTKRKSSPTSSKKWSIKDLLLFRSTSEGSATDKNHLFVKYSRIFRRQEVVKNSSYMSDDISGFISRRRGQVSAHELHYTANKAASNEGKKEMERREMERGKGDGEEEEKNNDSVRYVDEGNNEKNKIFGHVINF